MSIYEIIGGIALIISGIFLVVVVLLQEGKENGLSGAIQGGSTESYLNNNGGRTKDAKLKRATSFFAVVFFILSILANVAAVFLAK
ncbi:MAG: preprotein translocase subunit SecG [Oscillospiraceae bacterium]|nr:preprotein translocase subunit SecG [Oscillospiraceae bacterium]